MSTEIQQYEPRSEMSQWAEDAHQIAGMASKLVSTSFVPASYNGKAAEATAAILTGQEIGLKPMASLRSIVVIQGTPALTAQAIRGLVQSRGHDVWVEESTSQRAIVKGRRKGSDQVQTSTWDMQRATQLGVVNKDNWKKQPTAMLVARATSEVCRLIAADVLMGLAYSQEELSDEVAPDAAPEKKPATRKIARQPLPREDEPEIPDPEVVEEATGEVVPAGINTPGRANWDDVDPEHLV